MKQYLHKGTLSNLCYIAIGMTLFFSSFHIGESTLLGGIAHLSGCAFFCVGIHRRWCKVSCDGEDHC
jgi:hypothetical protein